MATIISSKTTGGGGASITGDTSGILQLASADGTTAVTIDASQNVGIGTASPSAKLDVVGNVQSQNPSYAVFQLKNSGLATNPYYRIAYDSANNLVFNNVNSAYTASTEQMRIDSSGNVLVTSPAGLGYGTGSGGTVTQATNKSTAVTLNKPTGQITMNNAALAAGATVRFDMNNSLASSVNDVAIVNVISSVNYSVSAYRYSGIIGIFLTNTLAISLSEAVNIQFAIIRGAIS